jgi:uncharacterized cupredoxin-like copper-binding protein
MRALAALSSACLILAAACGGASAPAVDPALGRVIEVRMSEFKFSPDTITVTPGEKVTFKLMNTGVVEHDFMAGLQATPGKGYAIDWIAKAVDGTRPPHTHAGEVHIGEGVRVSADWTLTLTVVVPEEKGEYEFGCFVQGHYEAGMKGRLVVR